MIRKLLRLHFFQSTLLISAVFVGHKMSAQALTGTKTIPGSYASLKLAIDSLNAYGVGTGGVTFDIAAGYTEILTQKLLVTATGTVANPIVFQKSGSGANPVITAYTGIRAPGASDFVDVIWAFSGSDYVTINQIDLKDTSANNSNVTLMMEVGYGFYKAGPTDGANNNTVQNCTITLNRDNNTSANGSGPRVNVTGSVGIELMNCNYNSVSSSLTITAVSGASSNNKFYGNTIQNCNFGIAMSGYAAASPYTLADVNNDIGGFSTATGNTIIDFGGANSGAAVTNPCAAVYISNQWSFNLSYNTINNNTGSGFNHGFTNHGIWLANASAGASCDVNYNTITITGGVSTSNANYCLDLALAQSGASGNTVNANYNQFLNCKVTAATTAAFYVISLQTGATTVNITNNYVYGYTYGGNPTAATGVIWGLASSSSPVTTNINNNTIDSTTFTGLSGAGTMAVIGIPSAQAGPTNAMNIKSNTISRCKLNTTGTGSASLFGIQYVTPSSGIAIVGTTAYNTIDSITRNGTTGGNIICINLTGGGSNGVTSAIVRKNTISNISINGTGTSGVITGIQVGSGILTCDSNTIYNIACQKTGVTGIMYGILNSSSTNETYTANTIYNLSHAGTATTVLVAGIGATVTTLGAVRTTSYNTIYNLSCAGGGVVGITQSGGTHNTFNNKIYDLSSTATNSSIVSGLNFTTGATYLSLTQFPIYNNLISGLTAPTSTGGATPVPTVRGVYIIGNQNNTRFLLSNNTILLSGTSSGTNFSSAGVYDTANGSATASSMTLRNNIIVNNTTPTGTGVAAAIWRGGTATLGNFDLISNRNLYYAGTGSGHAFLFDGGNTYTDSTAYITKVTPRDTNSFFSENPAFLSTTGSSPQFLKLDPSIATYSEAGGRNIAGITKDYATTIRAGNAGYTGMGATPDMGAWEADNLGQPINQMYFDSAGVNQSIVAAVPVATTNNIILRVRVYSAKGYNALMATSFKLNASTTSSMSDIATAKIYYTGNDSNFSTAQLFGITTAPTQTYYVTGSKRLLLGVNYFWVTYDISNTAILGDLVDAAVDSIVLTDSIAMIATNYPLNGSDPVGYRTIKSRFSGNTDVGLTSTAYTSLSAAMSDLTYLGVSGPATFTLTDLQYDSLTGERYPILLNAFPGSSSTNTVTIMPATGVASRIVNTNTIPNPVFRFNGGSNYIINGSQGGDGTFVSGNNLIVENTNRLANTINFVNDADSNSILYVDVKGADTLAAGNAGAGVINIGTTTGTTGNDNITIRYCDIHESSVGYPAVAVSAIGTATNVAMNNDNNTIDSNNIYNYYNAYVASAGIYVGANNGSWKVNANKFYQSVTRTHITAGVAHRAIWIAPTTAAIASSSGFDINNNYIGGNNANGTGQYNLDGSTTYTFGAIELAVGTGVASSVQGNTITNINVSTTSTAVSALNGIVLTSGKVNVFNNLIGSSTLNGAIVLNENSTTGGAFIGINAPLGTNSNFTIYNNTISGVDVYGGSSTTTPECFGMVVTCNAKVYNNMIGDTVLTNSLHVLATSTSSASAQRVYGLLMNTAASVTDSVYNNVIANITNDYAGNAGSPNYSVTKGITVVPNAGFGTLYIANNIIRNISTASQGTGTGNSTALGGIGVSTSSTGNIILTGNQIYWLKLAGTSLSAAVQSTGIYYSAPGNGANSISRNFIHSQFLGNPNAAAILTGIEVGGGNAIVTNNMIRLGIDSTGLDITTPCSFIGITKGATTGTGIYFNTVYIGGQSAGGGLGRSYAFQRTGAGTDNVLNNIFYNARTNINPSGGNFALSINNNTTLTQNFNLLKGDTIGLYNGTPYILLPDWKLGAGALDANSLATNAYFVNATGTASTIDLHTDTNYTTSIEAYGTTLSPTITGIAVDYDGEIRALLTPVDLGADAGIFTPIDEAAPVITYTALSNTTATTDRTLTATITDATGVYIAPGSPYAPRIYFTKPGYLPTWYSAAGTKTAGTAKNGTWQFTINASTLGGLTGGDSVYYFITAQDSTPNNNLGSIPGGAAGTDVSNLTFFPTSPATYRVMPIIGGVTIPVGAAQTYTTLTGSDGLFNYLNASVLSGDIIVQLVSDSIEEPGLVALNQLAQSGGSGYKVRIEPDAAAERLLVGNVTIANSALIRFDGCDRVTIDGSYAGSGKFIRIKNRGQGNTINLLNDADKDTIANCIIEGMNTTAATVVLYGTNVSGGTGNDSNVITGCIIRDTIGATGTDMPNTAFYSTTGNNDYNTFSNNEVYNFGYGGVFAETGNAWTITDNKFYQQRLKNVETIVIRVHSGASHNILRNSIGGSAADRSGSAWTTSTAGSNGAIGIYIPGSVAVTSSINVNNNIISNFGTTTAGVPVTGIMVSGGVVNVKYNTIGGGMNPYDTIRTGGSTTTTNGMIDIRSTPFSANITVFGNVISNIGYYDGVAAGTSGIALNASVATAMVIDSNTIKDMYGNSTSLSSASLLRFGGIVASVSGISVAITRNRISNIQSTNTGSVAYAPVGIVAITPASNNISITRNWIKNIGAMGTGTGVNAPVVQGIQITSGGGSTVTNNQIAIGDSAMNESVVYGISDFSSTTATNTYAYNSIYLNGSNSTGANSSAAFYRQNSTPVGVINNILYNDRTTMGTGASYAVALNSATGVSNSTLNYNLMVVTDTAKLMMMPSGTTMGWSGLNSLYATTNNTNWAEITTAVDDAMLFVNSSQGDLHIATGNSEAWYANGKGKRITTISGDFDNASGVRSTSITNGSTDIGSDEFTTSSLPPIAYADKMPIPGDSTQFFFASRMVAKLNWDLSGSIPSTVEARYYTGVKAPNLIVTRTAMNAYCDFQTTGGSGYGSVVTLMLDSTHFGDIVNPNNINVAKYDGTQWTKDSNTIINTITGTFTAGVTNFGALGIYTGTDGGNNPLPVRMMAFTAKVNNGDVIVDWKTASEMNNHGFEIERSLDGRSFESVGFVKGAGNSNTVLSYMYNDKAAFAQTSVFVLYYRLKQVDMNGSFNYSNIARVGTDNKEVNAVSTYPNPFTNEIRVSFNAAALGTSQIRILNIQGLVVGKLIVDVKHGLNHIDIENLTALPKGMYFVELTVNGETAVVKVVKE